MAIESRITALGALAAAAAMSVGLVASATAAELEPGARLAPIALEDQHGNAGRVDEETSVLLFTSDMDAGEIVRDGLADGGAARLTEAGAVYVSDVSAMPSLVFKLFAGPKLRERPYPMLLDRDGDATATLPSTEGRVTVVRLDRLEVVAIETVGSESELRAALAAGDAESKPESRPETDPAPAAQ